MINFSDLFQQIQTNLNILSNPVIITLMLGFMLFSSYTDIKSFKVYNISNLLFFVTRIILIFIPGVTFSFSGTHIVGAIIGAGFLLIPAMYLMYNMGGDIKFLFVLGMYLGAYNIAILIGISCALMLIFSLIRKIVTKKQVKDLDTPFVPFFTTAFILMMAVNMIF